MNNTILFEYTPCLVHNDFSADDFGKDFGRRVLRYYQHKEPEVAERKAELNDVYWAIEQVIYGYEGRVAYQYLRTEMCADGVILAPRKNNPRVVRAYQKAGFAKLFY